MDGFVLFILFLSIIVVGVGIYVFSLAVESHNSKINELLDGSPLFDGLEINGEQILFEIGSFIGIHISKHYVVVSDNYIAEILRGKIIRTVHKRKLSSIKRILKRYASGVVVCYIDENRGRQTIEIFNIPAPDETYNKLCTWANLNSNSEHFSFGGWETFAQKDVDINEMSNRSWNDSPIYRIDKIRNEPIIYRVVQSDNTPENTRDEFYWGFSANYLIEGIGGAFWPAIHKSEIYDIRKLDNTLIVCLLPETKYPNKYKEETKKNKIYIDKIQNIDELENFLKTWIDIDN